MVIYGAIYFSFIIALKVSLNLYTYNFKYSNRNFEILLNIVEIHCLSLYGQNIYIFFAVTHSYVYLLYLCTFILLIATNEN